MRFALILMLQRNASKFAIFYRIIFVDIDHVKLKDEQNEKQISNGKIFGINLNEFEMVNGKRFIGSVN